MSYSGQEYYPPEGQYASQDGYGEEYYPPEGQYASQDGYGEEYYPPEGQYAGQDGYGEEYYPPEGQYASQDGYGEEYYPPEGQYAGQDAYGEYNDDYGFAVDPTTGNASAEVDEYGNPAVYDDNDVAADQDMFQSSSWMHQLKIYPISEGSLSVVEYDPCQELLWSGWRLYSHRHKIILFCSLM